MSVKSIQNKLYTGIRPWSYCVQIVMSLVKKTKNNLLTFCCFIEKKWKIYIGLWHHRCHQSLNWSYKIFLSFCHLCQSIITYRWKYPCVIIQILSKENDKKNVFFFSFCSLILIMGWRMWCDKFGKWVFSNIFIQSVSSFYRIDKNLETPFRSGNEIKVLSTVIVAFVRCGIKLFYFWGNKWHDSI